MNSRLAAHQSFCDIGSSFDQFYIPLILSITASALALVGACNKLIQGITFLKGLSRAPEEILALSDELHALQNTLTAISLVMRDRRHELTGTLLAPLFPRAEHIIRELCDICGMSPERLAEVEETVYTDDSKMQLMTRFKWAREKRRVRQLQERLRVVCLDFANALATVSL